MPILLRHIYFYINYEYIENLFRIILYLCTQCCNCIFHATWNVIMYEILFYY
jgi:hypothetical protein